ncbi:histone deacetylase 11-like isoform X2 [Lineus longissimus]|uniref:histone deacetylase 11-like isoform X2 n=1 Tax=Lineus longissimus TaxID=88925 RepID=UPI00315CF713
MSRAAEAAEKEKEGRPHDTQLYVPVQPWQWPIIYAIEYNISFLGFEKLHPFDAGKWGRVHEFLKEEGMLYDHTTVKPTEASQADLMVVHPKRYIDSLKWSINVAGITEVPPVALLPNFVVQRKVLRPFRYQTGGTILAAKLAVERGWAINIGGGFHHCSADKGGGFCAYADITLAIKFQMERNPAVKKAMIIDLDAHQGNGHERDFMGNDDVYILDAYNRGIYPHDGYAKRGIKRKVELPFYCEDEQYLNLIRTHVEGALNEFTPDLVVYNAGTDILDGDPLGCLSISPVGIIERDQIVFEHVRARNIPIMMVTSGGYQRTTARIIADSILNLRALGLIPCEEAVNAPPPPESQLPVQSPPTTETSDGMKRSSSEATSLWAKFKRAGACISFPRSQTVNAKLADKAAVQDKEEEDVSAKVDVIGAASVVKKGETVASGQGMKGKTTESGEEKVEIVASGDKKGEEVASKGTSGIVKGETNPAGGGMEETIESGEPKADTLASRDVDGRTVTPGSAEGTAVFEGAGEVIVSGCVKGEKFTSGDRDGEIIASGGMKGQTFNGEKDEL